MYVMSLAEPPVGVAYDSAVLGSAATAAIRVVCVYVCECVCVCLCVGVCVCVRATHIMCAGCVSPRRRPPR